MDFLTCDFSLLLSENQHKRSFRRLYSGKFWGFIENCKMSFYFSVVKINAPTNFIRLRSKLTPETYQKVESLNAKMTENWLKTSTF